MQFKNLHILALAIAAQSANAQLNLDSIKESLAAATPSTASLETPAVLPVRIACIFPVLRRLPLTSRL